MRFLIAGVALVLVGMSAWLVSLRTPQTDLPKVALQVGDAPHQIEVQLATTPAQIAKGLMFTRSLLPDQGMLFVFDGGDTKRCMWMKNTPIALSIAFIAADGRIREIIDAHVNSNFTLCVDGVQKALELNQGWFKANGVHVGDLVEIAAQGHPSWLLVSR